MTVVDEQGRPEPPLTADEADTLLGFLEYQRETFAWKCAGLDAAGLAATVGASSITVGGMLTHLAFVEEWWCSRWLHGRDLQPPWATDEWETDRTWTGTRRPGRPRSSSARSGRTPWRGPAPWSLTRWPTAACPGRPAERGPTAGRPACAGSSSTSSRSTRGTPATPT